ncbi:MAG TPA: hypothetical protein VGB03_07525 [Acidimicrobiales bacterium]
MPAARTEVTELVTGLAMLGRYDDARAAVADRPSEVVNVSDDVWQRLAESVASSALRHHVYAAWANGEAFLRSDQGLRGRRPLVVEWKGPQKAPGDEVVPADLRVDHVYLVSCKYLSQILLNASPSRLFDNLLRGGPRATSGDWFAEVAPDAYQALYAAARAELPGDVGLPPFAADLTPAHRASLRAALADRQWPVAVAPAAKEWACEVGRASAARWRAALKSKSDQEALLWRLLRIGSAPYFVLGTADERSLRLRIATPWDWRQAYELRRFDAWGDDAGQPVVRWAAEVRDRAAGQVRVVEGHVEVRWSHGRFGGPPEAKVYLDTPHHRVPGYITIA